MITQIGRLCPGRLGVIARTSSMLFKRSAKSASEIGRELSADYLLEGSVRGDGDRIRITAQLIETRTEVHLWAETYDRSLGETLNLQTDVAAHIARSLAMELVPDQVDVLGRSTPRRTEAYQAYLKGRYHWNRGGLDGVRSAIWYYERALDSIPSSPRRIRPWPARDIARELFEASRGACCSNRRRASALRSIDSIRVFRTHIWRLPKSGARSNGTGERPKTNIERRSRCRRAASLRTAFTGSFSPRCRGSPRPKPKPTARATSILLPGCHHERSLGSLRGRRVRRPRSIAAGMCSTWTPVMPARRVLGAALLGAGRAARGRGELTPAAGPGGEDRRLACLAGARQGACRRAG